MRAKIVLWDRKLRAYPPHLPYSSHCYCRNEAERDETLSEREMLATLGIKWSRKNQTQRIAAQQTSDMCGIINSRLQGTADEIKQHEGQRADPMSPNDRGGHVSLLMGQECYEGAKDPKDRAGCAGTGMTWIPGDAGQARKCAGDEVENQKYSRAIQTFGQAANVPKRPHIQHQVGDIEVNEERCDQSPPLPVYSQRAKVRAPIQQLLRAKCAESRDNHHSDENRRVRYDQRGRRPHTVAKGSHATIKLSNLRPSFLKSGYVHLGQARRETPRLLFRRRLKPHASSESKSLLEVEPNVKTLLHAIANGIYRNRYL